MNRDILERPFEAALIKTRRGHSGKTLSYVEGAAYIRRLNEAFNGMWSFEIVDHIVTDHYVVVVGKLIAGGATKMAFGGSSITKSSQNGETLNLADDLKAAATDALKKGASMLGVGLHLYTDPERAGARSNRGNGGAPQRNNGNSHPAGVGNTNALTDRQLNAITAISRKLRLSTDELETRCTETYGVPPRQLSKAEASSFISSLAEEATNQNPM